MPFLTSSATQPSPINHFKTYEKTKIFNETFSATCDFEKGNLCTWANDAADNYDWVVTTGSTDTPYTGPSADTTLRNSSGTKVSVENQTIYPECIESKIKR